CYERARPDWVSMDYRMEPVDGIAATAAIRAHHPGARIVVVSNWDEPALREAARSAGALAYVLKNNLHQLAAIMGSGI
ncbi:MAG: response regulator, partial [Verrucomicrobiales bacterium]|nr:response regulator [Verrucomicrobiales bacterium]